MLESIIKKNRPNLAQSSIKTYLSSLSRIIKDVKVELKTPEDFIKNIDAILEKAKDYTAIVRKSKLAAVIVLLDDKDGLEDTGEYKDKDKTDAIKKLRFVMQKDMKTVDDEETNQELSEKQKENFVPQDDIFKIYELLKEQTAPLFKLNTLNKKQFDMMQMYVLLSLYILIPPRRTMDFTHFKIRNINPEVDNYFLIPKRKKDLGAFVFNQYKNAKKLGPQILERIPKELERIIDKWMQYNKSDYLLVNSVGKQVAGSKIALWLNEIFGKRISTSMLRHIYLTHKFGNVNLKELKDTAEDIGNSGIERMLKYVQKSEDV
jgi:hypothetical protein